MRRLTACVAQNLERELGITLNEVYERLEEIDSDHAEARAAQLLSGLGFDVDMQAKPTREYSGGWRMRIVLAQVRAIHAHAATAGAPSTALTLTQLPTLPFPYSHPQLPPSTPTQPCKRRREATSAVEAPAPCPSGAFPEA